MKNQLLISSLVAICLLESGTCKRAEEPEECRDFKEAVLEYYKCDWLWNCKMRVPSEDPEKDAKREKGVSRGGHHYVAALCPDDRSSVYEDVDEEL